MFAKKKKLVLINYICSGKEGHLFATITRVKSEEFADLLIKVIRKEVKREDVVIRNIVDLSNLVK